MGGGNSSLQSSPSNVQGGVNINRQLRYAGVSTGPEYYNLNPWVRMLGRAYETVIQILEYCYIQNIVYIYVYIEYYSIILYSILLSIC